MNDLFRYIEHSFAVPSRTEAIGVKNDSDFQKSLTQAAEAESARQQVRELAEQFVASTFKSPTADPVSLGKPLRELPPQLRKLKAVDLTKIRAAIKEAFGRNAKELAEAADFRADLELLQNSVLAVKLATAFAAVDTPILLRQLRAATFVADLAASPPDKMSAERMKTLLARPVRIPAALLKAAATPPQTTESAPASPTEGIAAGEADRIASMRSERDALQASFDALQALPPDRLELAEEKPAKGAAAKTAKLAADDTESASGTAVGSPPGNLKLGAAALEILDSSHIEALSSLPVDPKSQPLPVVVDALKARLRSLNEELLPLEVPGPAKVFRFGSQLLIETPPGPPAAPPDGEPDEAPPASAGHAVIRPVGVGTLLVVRQKLVGYEAGEISHIENVLQGELLKRDTRRTEVSETTLTEETGTTQSQERDQQSTDRNELAGESQKEAGSQSSSSSGSMSSTEYGKLVENSKSNFAQSVTSRAVDSVTQRVRRQRVERERKTFVEEAVHEFDNRKATNKTRGVYQWVDKRYSVSVLNYGKRLMYDLVVPEPAAFLVRALKDVVKPESGIKPEGAELEKPLPPPYGPTGINESNYAYLAARYGVTGSVSPPPTEYASTVAQTEAQTVEREVNAFGAKVHGNYFGAFKIRIPDGYRAVSGYVTYTNLQFVEPASDRWLEFYVGESQFFRYGPGSSLNSSFTLAGETGEIPVTVRSFPRITGFGFAVGINCQRTEKTYQEWQLKTHATIASGYQRQLSDYEDKLSRYVAAARAQLAAAGGLGHDPGIEQQELKKAFIYMLLGEHPGTAQPTPLPAPMPPSPNLPTPPRYGTGVPWSPSSSAPSSGTT